MIFKSEILSGFTKELSRKLDSQIQTFVPKMNEENRRQFRHAMKNQICSLLVKYFDKKPYNVGRIKKSFAERYL